MYQKPRPIHEAELSQVGYPDILGHGRCSWGGSAVAEAGRTGEVTLPPAHRRPPVILQLALGAVARLRPLAGVYLWAISYTVPGFIPTFTLCGVASYALFTLAAILSYSCLYRTPSTLTRSSIRYTFNTKQFRFRPLAAVAKPNQSGVPGPRRSREFASHMTAINCTNHLTSVRFSPPTRRVVFDVTKVPRSVPRRLLLCASVFFSPLL